MSRPSALSQLQQIQIEAKKKQDEKNITNEDLQQLHDTIVCYFADGSDEFTTMTSIAIRSFLIHTPELAVGLLTPNVETRDRVLSALPAAHLGRVICKQTTLTGHLKVSWNATQFKLDILKFTQDRFSTIVWMDSDTLVHNDITDFLVQFIKQKEKTIFMVRDHSMSHPEFAERWQSIASEHAPYKQVCAVPQACVMAFKRSVIGELFDAWRAAWNEYLLPSPFASIADPSDGARHSAFCIEQYALALAVTRLSLSEKVLWFARGARQVRVSSMPARPVLPSSFALASDFVLRVARRWSDFASGADLHATVEEQLSDAASDVKYRPGLQSTTDYGFFDSFASSSYGNVYSSYNNVLTSQQQQNQQQNQQLHASHLKPKQLPLLKVDGLEYEPLTALALSELAEQSQDSNPDSVQIDLFGDCIYHCYSRWFFYVLPELGIQVQR